MAAEANFHAIAPGLPDPFRLLIRDSVGSTNDDLRELAEAGTTEGLILLAREQTNGRGRRGASWFSPPGESLAFSVLLRPTAPRHYGSRLALAAGLAVAEAIEPYTAEVAIKWPNDVQIGGKKVAGVLVEAGADFAIVGIGININARQFPAEVAGIATSVAIAAGNEISMPEIFAAVIRHFSARKDQIGDAFPDLLQAVRLRCALTGKQVRLTTAGGQKFGTVEGFGPGGELLITTALGTEAIVQADEIRPVS